MNVENLNAHSWYTKCCRLTPPNNRIDSMESLRYYGQGLYGGQAAKKYNYDCEKNELLGN